MHKLNCTRNNRSWTTKAPKSRNLSNSANLVSGKHNTGASDQKGEQQGHVVAEADGKSSSLPPGYYVVQMYADHNI